MQAIRKSLPYFPWVPRTVLELARARITLARLKPHDLLALNAQFESMESRDEHGNAIRSAALERIVFLLPRLARRVPWRSDCLVQALAAQRWLAAYGVASQIEIGVQRDSLSTFRAHAWVRCDGNVLLGGEIREFTPLLTHA